MPRTDLKDDEEAWIEYWGDSDLDEIDEFCSGLIAARLQRVHAPDCEVEFDDYREDFNFGVQKRQWDAYGEVDRVDHADYMVDQDGEDMSYYHDTRMNYYEQRR